MADTKENLIVDFRFVRAARSGFKMNRKGAKAQRITKGHAGPTSNFKISFAS